MTIFTLTEEFSQFNEGDRGSISKGIILIRNTFYVSGV